MPEPNRPVMGIHPKRYRIGDNTQSVRVYGQHLNQHPIRRITLSSTTHTWSALTNPAAQNHYVDFNAYPTGSRGRRLDETGDLSVTITFQDGTTDNTTCEDITYEDPNPPPDP